MANAVKTTSTLEQKRWLVLAAWMIAAVIGGCLNLMQYVNFNTQSSHRSRLMVRSSASVAVPDVSLQESTTNRRTPPKTIQMDTILGGLAVGGAAAMFLVSSVTATISILNPSKDASSERATPSAALPLLHLPKRQVVSTTPASKAFGNLAPTGDGSFLSVLEANHFGSLAPMGDGGLLATIKANARAKVVAPMVAPTKLTAFVTTPTVVAPAVTPLPSAVAESAVMEAEVITPLMPTVVAPSVSSLPSAIAKQTPKKADVITPLMPTVVAPSVTPLPSAVAKSTVMEAEVTTPLIEIRPADVTTSSVSDIVLEAEASQSLVEEVAPTVTEQLEAANAHSGQMLSYYRYKKPTSLYSAAIRS